MTQFSPSRSVSFCISDDEFELKSKIYSLILLALFYSHSELLDISILRTLFLFYVCVDIQMHFIS